jgi:Lecithin retinol acyltransferase
MRLFKRGNNHDVRFSGCERVPFGRQYRGDWLLVGDQEPPLGSHLVTPRRGYLHHGIYVGARRVVHYAGLAHGLRRGPVEEVPFAHFARGQHVLARSAAPSDFDVREIICRARSRMGEDRYRLLTNNCEHFCEWCLRGTARSFQLEAWLERPRLTLLATLRLIIRVPISSLLREYATFIERFVPEKDPA